MLRIYLDAAVTEDPEKSKDTESENERKNKKKPIISMYIAAKKSDLKVSSVLCVLNRTKRHKKPGFSFLDSLRRYFVCRDSDMTVNYHSTLILSFKVRSAKSPSVS